MSIIQEALKKPKNTSQSAGGDGAAASPKAKEADEAFSTKKGKGISALLNARLRNKSIALFFYALAGISFAIYIFALFRSPAAPSFAPSASAGPGDALERADTVVKAVTSDAASQSAAPVNVFKTRPRFPNFILNGIMQLVDGPRAIVNNVIVGIGDVIGGATVERINTNDVVLKTRESVITLKMR